MQAFGIPTSLRPSSHPVWHQFSRNRCSKTRSTESATTQFTEARRPWRQRGAAPWICCADKTGEDAESDPLSFEQLFLKGPVPGDRLVRTISASGEVSCQAISCSGLVNGVAKLFKTTPVVTTAFGRALVSSLLLSSGKKGGETLQIEFRGSGPLNGMTVISNGSGGVRGYVGNAHVDLPLRNGRFDVPGSIGKGILAVVRNSPFMKTPYTGLVTISSGEVAEDIAQYLADSEQTPSALAAGVYIEADGTVGGAAGFLVTLLPGASEDTIKVVERNVRILGSPTEAVREGFSPEDVVDILMKDLNPLNIASVSPRYECRCGVDRVKRTVSLLSTEEVRDLLKKYGHIEATCEFCGQVYVLLEEEVEKLLAVKAAKTNSDEDSDEEEVT